MRRVLKWTVPVDGQDHTIGSGKVVHVACQYGDPSYVQVWTEEYEKVYPMRKVQAFGTGHQLDENVADHIGSVIATSAGQHFVWHLYEVR